MTEALERSARAKKIPILDNMLAVELIIDNNAVKGLVCIDKNALDNGCYGLTLISAEHVILATGGPAAIYQNRVYPESQAGMSGMALLAGVRASNLQEWQYGLASIKFRWNVSGTYQQALPRYISVDKNSVTSEFLPGYFDNPHKALDMVFLKGYQWPFDTRKAAGSSIIDLIIHHETFNLNRRVYMDFLKNPAGLEDGFNGLSAETRNYLRNSGALLKTPIARLLRMNAPAVSLYKKNGIDLHCEPLEVSVCAQHHNGGLAVDVNWQTNIGGLYAAGECAGTFGVYRPGGSALNSTQTGSMRAAEHIAYNSKPGRRFEEPEGFIKTAAETWIKNLGGIMRNTGGYRKIADFSNEMSSYASYIRDTGKMKNLMGLIQKELSGFFENASVNNIRELPVIIHARDTMVTQLAVLSAMVKSAEADGTHGSSLILSGNGAPVHNTLPMFSIAPGKPLTDNHLMITHIARNNGEISFESFCEPVRPIPKPESWFENVWKSYLERTAKTHLGGYNGD